jgi:hypothetical protein
VSGGDMSGERDAEALRVELLAMAERVRGIREKLRDAPPASHVDPESLAEAFHEAYERLAPSFGYKTREASAVPWAEVPDANRGLMIAVAGEVLQWLAPAAPPGSLSRQPVALLYTQPTRVVANSIADWISDRSEGCPAMFVGDAVRLDEDGVASFFVSDGCGAVSYRVSVQWVEEEVAGGDAE